MGGFRLKGVGALAALAFLFAGCAEQVFEELYVEGEIDVPDDLYKVTAVGANHAWAAGYFGAVYRTTDGGDNWSKLDVGTSKPIYDISFADEKTGWAVGQRGFIIHTTDGGETWTPQETPRKPARHMFGIQAVNTQTVWAVSDWGGLYQTKDGGTTWKDLSFTVDESHPTFKYLSDAELKNFEAGKKVYDDVYLNDIYFTDEQHGWIAAEYGMIFRTEDGGETWERGEIQGDVDFDRVDFGAMEADIPRDVRDLLWDAAEILVEKQYLRIRIEGFLTAAELAKRGDTFLADERAEKVRDFLEREGISQDRIRVLNPTPFDEESVDMKAFRKKKISDKPYARLRVIETPFLFNVKFKDPQNGMIAGLGGVILRSSDGGKTWNYAPADSKLAFFGGGFGAKNLVVVGERGQQRRSQDGGATWERYPDELFPEVFAYMRGISFGSPERGYIVGGGGLVLRTTDGGQSWKKVLPLERKIDVAGGE